MGQRPVEPGQHGGVCLVVRHVVPTARRRRPTREAERVAPAMARGDVSNVAIGSDTGGRRRARRGLRRDGQRRSRALLLGELARRRPAHVAPNAVSRGVAVEAVRGPRRLDRLEVLLDPRALPGIVGRLVVAHAAQVGLLGVAPRADRPIRLCDGRMARLTLGPVLRVRHLEPMAVVTELLLVAHPALRAIRLGGAAVPLGRPRLRLVGRGGQLVAGGMAQRAGRRGLRLLGGPVTREALAHERERRAARLQRMRCTHVARDARPVSLRVLDVIDLDPEARGRLAVGLVTLQAHRVRHRFDAGHRSIDRRSRVSGRHARARRARESAICPQDGAGRRTRGEAAGGTASS